MTVHLRVRVRQVGGPPGVTDRNLIERIEVYQSHWFPLVRAVLSRGYPEFVSIFFDKLTQLGGKDAVLSLGRFLEVLGKLGLGETPFGAVGTEARALLATRTLTAEVEAEGNALLAEWSKVAAVEDVDSNEYREAVEEVWKWYCEWRDLARLAIKSRRLLRALGMGRRLAISDEEEGVEEEGPEEGDDEGEVGNEDPTVPGLEITPVAELPAGGASSAATPRDPKTPNERQNAAE